jgi:hypothetical protein
LHGLGSESQNQRVKLRSKVFRIEGVVHFLVRRKLGLQIVGLHLDLLRLLILWNIEYLLLWRFLMGTHAALFVLNQVVAILHILFLVNEIVLQCGFRLLLV